MEGLTAGQVADLGGRLFYTEYSSLPNDNNNQDYGLDQNLLRVLRV